MNAIHHQGAAVLAVLLTTSAAAQTSAPRAALSDPRLEALVAEALDRAPEAAQAAAEAARQRVEPAGTLPDPFVSSDRNAGRSSRGDVRSVARESLESALASYQAGKIPFITVLGALNTPYYDASMRTCGEIKEQ